MRNETLKNLLLTASLISASAFLTACGDDPKPSTSAEQAAPTKATGILVDNTQKEADILEKVLSQNAKTLEPILQAITSKNPDSKPQYDEYQKHLGVMKADLDTLKGRVTSVSNANTSGSYNQYVKAVDAFKNIHQSLDEIIPKLESAAQAAWRTGENSTVENMAQLNALHTQTVSEAKLFLTQNQATQFDASIANFDEFYNNMHKKDTQGGVFGFRTQYSSFANNMAEKIQTNVLELRNKGGNVLTDESIELTNGYPELDAISDSISGFVQINQDGTSNDVSSDSKQALQNLIKDGKLTDVVTQLTYLLKSKITLELPTEIDQNQEAKDHQKYTLAEIREFIESDKVKGRTTPEYNVGVNSSKLYGGAKPTIALVNQISALLDTNLPAYIKAFLLENDSSQQFFKADKVAKAAQSFSAPRDQSSTVSLRPARISGNGVVNLAAFNMNGSAGQSVDLGMPLFVQLKGDVSSAKSTEAVTGSVAYRLGSTVIGAIQGYANSGAGFEADSTQRETSLVASQSFGAFFVEGQIGSVSATNVHNHDWSGLRSQLTVGFDAEFVSPFLQLTHRQLERSGINLSETTGYVGLNMNVAKLAADTYSIDTHLQAKAGYGSKDASMAGFKDHVSTAGFKGSVEWSASLNLNSGVAFSSNLALDTVAGSSAGLTVSLDR